MNRESLTPEEYGAAHLDSAVELSKDDVIARWAERYERLRASSARQMGELASEVARLTSRVGALEELLQEHGISDGLSVEAGLALLMGAVRAPSSAHEGVVVPTPVLTLPAEPCARLPFAHSSQNVLSVAVPGRVRELEDMPVLVLTGGADRKLVASLFAPESGTLVSVASLSLSAPVLDLAAHPESCSPTMDDALCVAALMDGSLACVRVSVDLSASVPVSARPPFVASLCDVQRHHSKFITRVRWAPDGNHVATASQDYSTTTYQIAEGDKLDKVFSQQFTGCVEAIEFVTLRDCSLVPTGQYEARFLVCAVRGSPTLFYINRETRQVSRVGISEDSGPALLLSASAPDVSFTRVGFTVLDLALSPDGMYLAAATDHAYHFLYRPGTSMIMRRLCGHTVDPMSSVRLCWHSSGHFLCSTSDKDDSAHVWDVQTQASQGRTCFHTSRVRALTCWHDARRGDSAYVVSVSFDKSVAVWHLPWVTQAAVEPAVAAAAAATGSGGD